MQTEQRTRHAHRATAPIANTLPLHATRCIVDVKVLVWKPWRSLYAATMERLRSGALLTRAAQETHMHTPKSDVCTPPPDTLPTAPAARRPHGLHARGRARHLAYDSCTHRHAPRPCGGLVLPFMSTRMTTRVPWH